MTDALGAAITRLRERIDATEKADLVTQDLLISITADLEKQRWMFEAENHPGSPENAQTCDVRGRRGTR